MILKSSLIALAAALSLASAPVAAQPADTPQPAPEQQDRRGMEGEAIGYLALPALLVLTLLVGLLLSGDGEKDMPVSP